MKPLPNLTLFRTKFCPLLSNLKNILEGALSLELLDISYCTSLLGTLKKNPLQEILRILGKHKKPIILNISGLNPIFYNHTTSSYTFITGATEVVHHSIRAVLYEDSLWRF